MSNLMTDHPCPFCGSADIEFRQRRGAYDWDAIYCNGCKTEFTYYPTHIADVWNHRTETDSEHCPFCGSKVEFDGNMNSQFLFPDAYCPTCRWRIQFQGVKAATTKKRDADEINKCRERTMAKARKAFARRTEVDG